jgi:hypothetical protein
MRYSPVSRDYYERKIDELCETYQLLSRVKNYNKFTVEQKEVLEKAMNILNDKVDEFENILDDENMCFFNPNKD